MTTRREFMVGVSGLTFGILLEGCAATPEARERSGASLARTPAGGARTVNAWASLSPDGTIWIVNPAVEMGQGSQTAIPLIIAEEMDADWSRVVIVPAAPDDKVYGNPGFRGLMYTAGSATVTGYWDVARTFGAQVRRVMMENAARLWNVPLAELSTEPSTVVHAKSGRRLGYGEIAAVAQLPAVAPAIKPEELKQPGQYRLIGKDVMRVELPSKVDGSAQYSIDVQLPGMLYGAVLRGPVEGSAPLAIDDSRSRAIPGVVSIVRMSFGVGVIAETPWAAFGAKDALEVTWDRRARAFGHDSARAPALYSAAARDLTRPGKPWDSAGDAPAAMQKAAKIYEAEYICDYTYHAQMEPLNSVASVSAAGDACEIWCGTQSQTMAVAAVAKALGIAPEKVKLNLMLLGGGFGRRGHRDEEFVVDSVLLSKEVKRPVKVLWTREDDVKNGRFRPLSVHYLRAGLDGAGHRSVAAPRRLRRDHRVPGPGALQGRRRARLPGDGRIGAAHLRHCEPALGAASPADRDPHLVAARHRLRAEQVRDRGLPRRDRGEARPRSRGPQAAAAEEHAARPGGGARGGGDVRVPPRAAGPRPRLLLHRLLGNDGGRGGGSLGGQKKRQDHRA